MPPLTREQFDAARREAIERAPEGLTREQFQAYLDRSIDAAERGPEPSTFAGGFARSIADTGMRTLRGVVRGVSSSIAAPFELADDVLMNGGARTIAGLRALPESIPATARAIASGDPEVGGEAIGALLTGGVAGRVLPRVPAAASRSARAAAPLVADAADLGMAAAKGGAMELPFVGPITKGAIRGVQRRIKERSDAAPQAVEQLAEALAEGYDRFMPNTSAPRAASAPRRANLAQLADELPDDFGPDAFAGPRVQGRAAPPVVDDPLRASFMADRRASNARLLDALADAEVAAPLPLTAREIAAARARERFGRVYRAE